MNYIKQLLIASVWLLFSSCNSQNCSDLRKEFTSYEQAKKSISSTSFTFSDKCNTSKSSWILGAEYYSCDGKTGYFIIEAKSKNYIHSGVPIEMWHDFKNTNSFGSYYNRYLKGRYQLIL